MAESPLMWPIAGVFLVAFVSGIMSQPPPSPPLSSPSQAPATPPTSGVVYSKPYFNSTFFVHENLLVVAGPGGDLNKLQLGSVVVVTDTIRKTSDPSSKVLGVFEGQYVQDGNETLHVTATATIFADSENPYNTTYEIVGQRTSLTSTDGLPLSVVSGIQFNLETKEYFYGLIGISFIHTVFTQSTPQKLSLVPSPSPSHPSDVEVPQALQQNIFQISIFFCEDGRCQF
jgi:hypothetical protein